MQEQDFSSEKVLVGLIWTRCNENFLLDLCNSSVFIMPPYMAAWGREQEDLQKVGAGAEERGGML